MGDANEVRIVPNEGVAAQENATSHASCNWFPGINRHHTSNSAVIALIPNDPCQRYQRRRCRPLSVVRNAIGSVSDGGSWQTTNSLFGPVATENPVNEWLLHASNREIEVEVAGAHRKADDSLFQPSTVGEQGCPVLQVHSHDSTQTRIAHTLLRPIELAVVSVH